MYIDFWIFWYKTPKKKKNHKDEKGIIKVWSGHDPYHDRIHITYGVQRTIKSFKLNTTTI